MTRWEVTVVGNNRVAIDLKPKKKLGGIFLARKIAQGFNQPRLPLHTLTKTIDLTKAFDMVNHTKLIRALTLSKHPLYLKGRTASCRCNFTLSSSLHARVGNPQGACVSPTAYLIQLLCLHTPQSDNILTNSYAEDFTVRSRFGDGK